MDFSNRVHGMSIFIQITPPTTSIWTAKASQEVQRKRNPLQRKHFFQFLKIRDFFLAFKICSYIFTEHTSLKGKKNIYVQSFAMCLTNVFKNIQSQEYLFKVPGFSSGFSLPNHILPYPKSLSSHCVPTKKKINSQIFMRRLCSPKKSESSKIRQKIRTDFDNIFKKAKGKLVVVQAVVKGLWFWQHNFNIFMSAGVKNIRNLYI